MQMQLAHTVLACISVLQLVAALNNGLARTPPMGWMVRGPASLRLSSSSAALPVASSGCLQTAARLVGGARRVDVLHARGLHFGDYYPSVRSKLNRSCRADVGALPLHRRRPGHWALVRSGPRQLYFRQARAPAR